MEAPAPPAIRCRGVGRNYGKHAALAGFELDVAPGEFFGLIGENGAGKTTFLKCLLDFCLPDAGSIEIFGVSARRTGSRARLAYLPERFTPPYYLTGRDFLQYMAEMHGVAYSEQAAVATLERLDLAPAALDKAARSYSKGMTQKLGLASCLLSGKDLYVLDEPTSGLDPKARALLKRELRRLHSEGRTIFITSHALADVEEMCDRMAVLHAGTLRFAGAPRELMSRHAAANIEAAFLACIGATLPA